MAPKQHKQHGVSDERKEEIKQMFEAAGFDVDHWSYTEAEWCDKALDQGWKVPTKQQMLAAKAQDTSGKEVKHLRTFAIRAAREHIGEPVGQKHEA